MEAALVTPLLVLLVLGIIEFSFTLRDFVAVSSDVRVGARVASTGAAMGPGTCDVATGVVCVPANTPALAQLAADSIQRSGSAMPQDEIDYILVYKANLQGYPGSDGNTTMPTSCAGYNNCVMFKWVDSKDAFRYTSGAWVSSTISACFPGNASYPLDRVGVFLHATHPFITGLFGTTIGLRDHAVMDFEPLATQQCGSGQHQ